MSLRDGNDQGRCTIQRLQSSRAPAYIFRTLPSPAKQEIGWTKKPDILKVIQYKRKSHLDSIGRAILLQLVERRRRRPAGVASELHLPEADCMRSSGDDVRAAGHAHVQTLLRAVVVQRRRTPYALVGNVGACPAEVSAINGCHVSREGEAKLLVTSHQSHLAN